MPSMLHRSLFLITVLIFLGNRLSAAETIKVNVMGDLLLETEKDFQHFSKQLQLMKSSGVKAISIDVWWGLVEKEKDHYDFRYYDRVFDQIKEAGLLIVPILSTHRLGGNVGDNKTIEIPQYLWEESEKDRSGVSVLAYKSEQLLSPEELKQRRLPKDSFEHRSTTEVISPWGQKDVSQRIENFYRQFFIEYRYKLRGFVDEVNISLGPAGELRHPSYNSHDKGSGYPHRGSLQIYSDRAIEGLRTFAKARFGSIENFNKETGFDLKSFSEVNPPHPHQLANDHFYRIGEHLSTYGKLVFDYNQYVLLNAGKINLNLAANAMREVAPEWVSDGVPLGAKIPGIHWRTATDRLAELPSGLISTSSKNLKNLTGEAYKPVIDMFLTTAKAHSDIPFLVHFTALEFNDREELNSSLAKTLSLAFIDQAKKSGLQVAGENALGFKVHSEQAMRNLGEAVDAGYSKLTLLRINGFSDNSNSTQYLKNLIQCKYSFRK